MADLIWSWAAAPLLLILICTGSGLAVEAVMRQRLPGPLLPAMGLALIVVLGGFLTLGDSTAELTTPAVVAVAVAGFVAGLVSRRSVRPDPMLVIALAALFAVYAAPVVATGDPTIAGFIKLDDTATWLTFTDQIGSGGRDLSGLERSTYLRTLEVNVGEGYPVGVFVPLAVLTQLTSIDPAWLVQPYMAVLALVFAAAAWTLVARAVKSPVARAVVVFVASQASLIYGYYLWGGIKELAAVALIAAAAALSALVIRRPGRRRLVLPLALVSGALVGVLTAGGLIWLLPMLLATLFVLSRRLHARVVLARTGAFAACLAVFAIPVLATGAVKPPTSSPLSDDQARGNLIEPLDPLQIFGIWPAGDFRVAPDLELVALLLVAFAATLALLGLAGAVRRRHSGPVLALAAALVGFLALFAIGSPWVDGKAMATASPLILLSAALGAVALGSLTRPVVGWAALVLLAGAVLWSNALAYGGAFLAPHGQLSELEEIGHTIEGEGPTLMTEYSPYGARHFLRDGDPESISELRFRPIPLGDDGSLVEKGLSADTDDLDSEALAVYRTLVIRRSPAASRPPSSYELTWAGDFYEVWQRAEGAGVPSHLSLGGRFDPIAEPRCSSVRALASLGDGLVAATRPGPIVVARNPGDDGSFAGAAVIGEPGEYEVWLGGSVHPRAELVVDGKIEGEVRHELNNRGGYTSFGTVSLDEGIHEAEVRIGGPDLGAGSAGGAGPAGPLMLSASATADTRIREVPVKGASQLCGREWDWIEVAED